MGQVNMPNAITPLAAHPFCELIDLDEERDYWLALFEQQPSLRQLGGFNRCWPLVLLGYSRYLTHIRSGDEAFDEAFRTAADASTVCHAPRDVEHLLATLRRRLAELAQRFVPLRRGVRRADRWPAAFAQ